MPLTHHPPPWAATDVPFMAARGVNNVSSPFYQQRAGRLSLHSRLMPTGSANCCHLMLHSIRPSAPAAPPPSACRAGGQQQLQLRTRLDGISWLRSWQGWAGDSPGVVQQGHSLVTSSGTCLLSFMFSCSDCMSVPVVSSVGKKDSEQAWRRDRLHRPRTQHVSWLRSLGTHALWRRAR